MIQACKVATTGPYITSAIRAGRRGMGQWWSYLILLPGKTKTFLDYSQVASFYFLLSRIGACMWPSLPTGMPGPVSSWFFISIVEASKGGTNSNSKIVMLWRGDMLHFVAACFPYARKVVSERRPVMSWGICVFVDVTVSKGEYRGEREERRRREREHRTERGVQEGEKVNEGEESWGGRGREYWRDQQSECGYYQVSVCVVHMRMV